MRAVTFQAPGEVRIEDVPEPEIVRPDDAIVQVEASGICGSDLHIYHGRVPVEPGFTIGHEFVGTVLAAGSELQRASVGDRVLGCFHTACGTCCGVHPRRLPPLRARPHVRARLASSAICRGLRPSGCSCPSANLTLRRVPDGMSAEVALFAGDVLGTGYHAVWHAGMRAATRVAVLGLGPVGLCAVQAARARPGDADRVRDRHGPGAPGDGCVASARRRSTSTDEDPKRVVRAATGGAGVDVVVDAVGDLGPLALAVSLARDAGTISGIGAYAGRARCRSV